MSKSWVFTINNPNDDDIMCLLNIKCGYIVYALERAPTTGTPHYQGYIEFINKTKHERACVLLGKRAYVAGRRGTQLEAADYCKKGGTWTERGTPYVQGARTDLDRARSIASDEGMRVVTSICNLQQISVARQYLTYNESARDWEPEVIWIWGKSGAGKSRHAREITGSDVYCKNNGTKWWDGYDRHEDVIIDDFRDSWWTLTEMLSLLDRYEKMVEYKGGWRQFVPKKIIITSIFPPGECYKIADEDAHQLLRRLSSIVPML